MSQNPALSVVVPFFDEQDNVEALHAEIVVAMTSIGRPWEAIYVDDGSRDATWDRLLAARASHPGHVRAVRLRRNFGQTAARAAGFDRSRGQIVITLDGDRQNDPADIPRLLATLEKGYDLVSGWRRDRKDAFASRRLPSRLANRLIGMMTGVRLHDYGCTLKAYRSEVVREIALFGEMHRFLPAQASWVGARIAEIPVHHRPRTAGVSKYGLWRTYRVILDLITVRFLGTHGTKPLHAFGALGLLLVLAGVLSIGVLTWLKISTGVSFIQSPLLLLSAMFVILGGQSVLLGLLAEISVRTYYESQRKPIYIVREDLADPTMGRSRAPVPDTAGRPPAAG